jgi:hypothetical protein
MTRIRDFTPVEEDALGDLFDRALGREPKGRGV